MHTNIFANELVFISFHVFSLFVSRHVMFNKHHVTVDIICCIFVLGKRKRIKRWTYSSMIAIPTFPSIYRMIAHEKHSNNTTKHNVHSQCKFADYYFNQLLKVERPWEIESILKIMKIYWGISKAKLQFLACLLLICMPWEKFKKMHTNWERERVCFTAKSWFSREKNTVYLFVQWISITNFIVSQTSWTCDCTNCHHHALCRRYFDRKKNLPTILIDVIHKLLLILPPPPHVCVPFYVQKKKLWNDRKIYYFLLLYVFKPSYQYLNVIFPRDFIPFFSPMPSFTLLLIQTKFCKYADAERIKLKKELLLMVCIVPKSVWAHMIK